jgi:hypothetical protein
VDPDFERLLDRDGISLACAGRQADDLDARG